MGTDMEEHMHLIEDRPGFVRTGEPWSGPVPHAVGPREKVGHLIRDGSSIRIEDDEWPGYDGLLRKIDDYKEQVRHSELCC